MRDSPAVPVRLPILGQDTADTARAPPSALCPLPSVDAARLLLDRLVRLCPVTAACFAPALQIDGLAPLRVEESSPIADTVFGRRRIGVARIGSAVGRGDGPDNRRVFLVPTPDTRVTLLSRLRPADSADTDPTGLPRPPMPAVREVFVRGADTRGVDSDAGREGEEEEDAMLGLSQAIGLVAATLTEPASGPEKQQHMHRPDIGDQRRGLDVVASLSQRRPPPRSTPAPATTQAAAMEAAAMEARHIGVPRQCGLLPAAPTTFRGRIACLLFPALQRGVWASPLHLRLAERMFACASDLATQQSVEIPAEADMGTYIPPPKKARRERQSSTLVGAAHPLRVPTGPSVSSSFLMLTAADVPSLVHVVCPRCGCDIPNPDGQGLWVCGDCSLPLRGAANEADLPQWEFRQSLALVHAADTGAASLVLLSAAALEDILGGLKPVAVHAPLPGAEEASEATPLLASLRRHTGAASVGVCVCRLLRSLCQSGHMDLRVLRHPLQPLASPSQRAWADEAARVLAFARMDRALAVTVLPPPLPV
jgi:hypothetical protein